MGKMKQMFEQQESINQLNNNKMTKKTMQQKLRKQPEPIVETRKEALRRLYKENGLTEEDIYKDMCEQCMSLYIIYTQNLPLMTQRVWKNEVKKEERRKKKVKQINKRAKNKNKNKINDTDRNTTRLSL